MDDRDVAALVEPLEPCAPANMVWIPGGTFRMGSDRHYPEEAPAHRVTVDGFWADASPVTNREFRKFLARIILATSTNTYPRSMVSMNSSVISITWTRWKTRRIPAIRRNC